MWTLTRHFPQYIQFRAALKREFCEQPTQRLTVPRPVAYKTTQCLTYIEGCLLFIQPPPPASPPSPADWQLIICHTDVAKYWDRQTMRYCPLPVISGVVSFSVLRVCRPNYICLLATAAVVTLCDVTDDDDDDDGRQ